MAIIVGHNLRLSCYAVGKAGVQFQWFKTKEEVGSLLGCVLKVDRNVYALVVNMSLNMFSDNHIADILTR